MKSLLIVLSLLSLAQASVEQTAKEFKQSQTEVLSPFMDYDTPLALPKRTKVLVGDKVQVLDWDGEKFDIRSDHEVPDPLIIKISEIKYMFISKGKYMIKTIERGAEELFDKYYGIQKPPEPPKGGDNSNYWEDPVDRWKWKP